jgi:hypothetical protein
MPWNRNGLIPERKAGTRGYDWENGQRWSFDVETFIKVPELAALPKFSKITP